MTTLRVVCVALLLSGSAAVQAQIDELPRPSRADSTTFGVSVAIEDSIAVVGASGERSCGLNAGAVYVYEWTTEVGGGRWRHTDRLVPRDCRANMFFGETVSLSGRRVLIGASSEYFADEESNAAYVFTRDSTGGWHQSARLTGETGRQEGLFAAGLDLEADRAVVSTSGSSEGEYGGAVYVFERSPSAGDEWRQTARLTASRGPEVGVLGYDVALHGDRLAVAASTFFQREPGSVYLFHHDADTGRWRETERLSDIHAFFIDLSLDDRTLVVGEERYGSDDAGAATVYTMQENDEWTQTATLQPDIPYESGAFGSAVSIQDDRILVSGYDEQLGKDFNIDRVVYVFERGGKKWRERPIIDVGDVAFGAAMDQDEGVALVSSVPSEGAGAVYVVRLP